MAYTYKEFFTKVWEDMNRPLNHIDCRLTVETHNSWKQNLREALFKVTGLDQLQEIRNNSNMSLNGAKELYRINMDGFIKVKYEIETLPSVFMPFYVLIPDSINKGQIVPTVIALPAHGASKESVIGNLDYPEVKDKLLKTPKEAYGLKFVRQGFVVICPDPPGYGERAEEVPLEDASFGQSNKPNILSANCKNLALTAEALGYSFAGLVLNDLICLLDFIVTQTYVDKDRIGCAGFSGGGLYTLLLSSIDDRIKVSVMSGYLHGIKNSILETHLCPCNFVPKLWTLTDLANFAGTIAPRYLLIETGRYDPLNGKEGVQDTIKQFEELSLSYAQLGCENNVELKIFNGGHEWFGYGHDFMEQYL